MNSELSSCGRPILAGMVGLWACVACAGDWPAIHGNMDHTGATAESLEVPLALAWSIQADQPPSPAFPKGLTGRFEYDPAAQDLRK
jgi:hypothetical protein